MGADTAAETMDSIAWYQRFVVPLVTSRFFPRWEGLEDDPALSSLLDERLEDTWSRFAPEGPLPEVWGWKYCETAFVMPLVAKAFPGARFVHVVRDGRDVASSRAGYFQVTGPPGDPPGWDPPPLRARERPEGDRSPRASYMRFCLAVAFDDPAATSWGDVDLSDPAERARNRFRLQMKAWVNSVERARRYGAASPGRYVEVRYEDLCLAPAETGRELLARLKLPLTHAAERFLDDGVHSRRVGRWKSARRSRAEEDDLARAAEWGGPVLRAFGYG